MSVTRRTEEKISVEKTSKNYSVDIHLSNGQSYHASLTYTGALSNPSGIMFRTVEEMKEAGRLLLDAVADAEQAIAATDPPPAHDSRERARTIGDDAGHE